jgi:misacylated tRNA(Ala) deacylase
VTFGGIGRSSNGKGEVSTPPEGRSKRATRQVVGGERAWENETTSEAAPMAELLYETDSYLRDFVAQVVAVEGPLVALNRTAFHPTGGGQLCDKGALIHQGVVKAVTETRYREGEVWHLLHGLPPPAGEAVLGHIDWQRRYALMRTHTALHILGAVIRTELGKPVSSLEIKPLAGRLDFEFENLTLQIADLVERRLNEEIAAARPVRIALLPREEASKIPHLVRTKTNLLPEEITMVRIVEIEGLDLQEDAGTHVANTREIGPVKLVGHESKGRRSKRLRIELSPGVPEATEPPS